jgi:hypothetical protein
VRGTAAELVFETASSLSTWSAIRPRRVEKTFSSEAMPVSRKIGVSASCTTCAAASAASGFTVGMVAQAYEAVAKAFFFNRQACSNGSV